MRMKIASNAALKIEKAGVREHPGLLSVAADRLRSCPAVLRYETVLLTLHAPPSCGRGVSGLS